MEDWEITKNDDRSQNQVSIFIIFCEDENDEPSYFRSFQIAGKVKINCIPNQKSKKLNLNNTLKYCQQKELLECINHVYKLKDDVTENIWCVYDRDLENENLQKIKATDSINFTTSIDIAQKAGLKIAWSNDAFELWVLLHFEMPPTEHKVHRKYLYDRLTEIFRQIPEISSNPKFSKIISLGRFNYKLHLKKREIFLSYILPVLKTKTKQAINNAINLESIFSNDVPYHDCNPCTKVHHLVKDIILAGSI